MDSKVIDLIVKTCLDVNGETDEVMPLLIAATKWNPNREVTPALHDNEAAPTFLLPDGKRLLFIVAVEYMPNLHLSVLLGLPEATANPIVRDKSNHSVVRCAKNSKKISRSYIYKV